MDTTTFTSSTVKLYKQVSGADSTQVTVSSYSFATSTGKNILTLTLGSSLAANSKYHLIVTSGVKSSVTPGVPLFAQYESYFETGASADTTAPTVVGVFPTSGTTIPANTSDFVVIFDDSMNASTATTGSITLAITGGAKLPGSVRYDPVSKEAHFLPGNVLPVGQSLTLTLVGTMLKNASDVTLGSNITKTWTVEASNTDTTAPSVLFANVDEFSVAVTFNEAVNAIDATTLSNYSLLVNNATQTPSALAGHTITYDASTRTAKLLGLRLSSGASVTATVSNVKDISGNLMTSSSAVCTVSSSTGSGGTGGFVGPATFTGTTQGTRPDFSSAGIGFMPPVTVRPSSTFISASSTYAFELPISKQIGADGTIVVTFPSSADFGLCCAATTSAKNPFLVELNKDINGPSSGTVGIKTIAKDAVAKTITLTLDTATRSESGSTHDFLKFSLADIRNASVPKGIDSSGYALDIKSKSSTGTLLETFSANPIYIGGGTVGGGSTTRIRGTVKGNGIGLVGVTVHLMSPQTGPLDATTDSTGAYLFNDIPVGTQFLTNNFGGGNDYMLFTDPFISGISDVNGATTTAFFGDTMPTPVQATSTSHLTRDFSLTATSSAVNFDVRLTASANTFTASEQIDVFGGGPGKFIVRTVTPGASALTNSLLTTLPIPQVNGSWGIGIGPAMPKGIGGGFSGPPPAPNWSMPKPIVVTVSGCPSACATTVNGAAATSNLFSIATADKTIAGVLKDGSGNAIAGAMVFAYSSSQGTGNHGQSSTSCTFSVNVAAGSYNVGAFSPGVGKSREVPVVVDSSGNVYVDGSSTASTGSSGANAFTLKMVKPDYTISGQVTDGTSAVGNAPVFAYRTDGPGHADALSDSSTGNYTLYVSNGTWRVSAFVPGFGPMTEQAVTVSGSSQSSINFAPSSSASFSIYSGNIYDDADNNNTFATSSEGIVGAVIRLSGASGKNEGVSGAEGSFSVRVPAGSGYSIAEIFHPTYGRIAALNSAGSAIGTLNLTASSTNNYIRVPKRNTLTVNIKDSSGNLTIVPKAFIDLYNTTTKQGSHVEITNASSTTIQIATGTSPTVRAFIQGVPPSNVSIASDAAGTAVSSNVVTVDDTTETIKVVVNTSSASLSTISGTVSDANSTAVEDVWIQFVDETNGVFFGTLATTSGKYSIKAANGTYTTIASKPGYVGPTASVTVSGNTTKNFTLTAASLTISGTVTAGGSAAANAFVRAEKIGGGQAITQTDTSGAYSLSVTSGTWKVFATAEGYSEGASSANPIVVGSSAVTGKNVALTSAVSLQTTLATSNTFTDTAAASFSDGTVGVDVTLDSNTLGSAGNSAYLTAKETSNYPNTASVNIVGSKAKDINAFSGGSQVKTLATGKSATVELTYTKAELASSNIDTTTEVANLKMVSYSEDKKEWESLSTVATYFDSASSTVTSPTSNLSNVAFVEFTAVGTHFSAYALSAATGVSPPDTPGSVAATRSGSSLVITWGASSGSPEGYYVYRDTSDTGSFALLADVSGGSTASYTDSSASVGTTYYYKVSAYKSSGSSESSASSAVNSIIPHSGGGGGGGGGGGASTAPPPRAQKVYPDGTVVYLDEPGASARMKELDAKLAKEAKGKKVAEAVAKTSVVPAAERAQASTVARGVSPVFNKDLIRGARGDDVKRLQALLEVEQSGLFGTATEKTLKAFQLKHGIIRSEKSTGAGKLGPATRAKLKEVFGERATMPEATATPSVIPSPTSPSSSGPAPALTRTLGSGSRGDDVKALQSFLGVEATGHFGSQTKAAIVKFQLTHGIVHGASDPGYGKVGPKTRAKLMEVGNASASAGSPVESTTRPSGSEQGGKALEKQLEDALTQLRALQADLKKAQ